MATEGESGVQRAIQVFKMEGPKRIMEHTRLVEDKPKPQAGPGELIVQMRVRPLNPADGLSLMGLYPGFRPPSLPGTPGLEGMGVVAELGPGAEGFKVGQRVVPLLHEHAKNGNGSWQQYVKIKPSELVAVPDSVSDEAAAQLVVNPVTAIGLLNDLDVPKGEYVIQSAAGSTIGRQIIALAKHRGVKSINVVRRKEQKQELLDLGADVVISTDEDDVVSSVKKATDNKLAYGGIDSVAGATTKMLLSSIRPGGTLFVLGGLGGGESTVAISDLIFRDAKLHGWWLSNHLQTKSTEEKQALLQEVMGCLESGLIQPFWGEKHDLADFGKALKKQQEPGRGGKVLLTG